MASAILSGTPGENQDRFASDTVKLYDAIAQKYQDNYQFDVEQHLSLVWTNAYIKAKSRILDLGSGTGIPVASSFVEAGHIVKGLDISSEMVKMAKKNVPNADFEVADLRRFEEEAESFDVVCCYWSLFQMTREDAETVIRKAYKALVPGGLIIVVTIPGDLEVETIRWLGQDVTETKAPRDWWFKIIREAGFEIRRTCVSENEDEPGGRRETNLYVHGQKPN